MQTTNLAQTGDLSAGEAGDSGYLVKVLGDALQNALAEIVALRPSDPIEFLALWLRKHAADLALQQQEEGEKRQLEREAAAAELEVTRQQELRHEAEHMRSEEERRKLLFLRRSQEIDEIYRKEEEERFRKEQEKEKETVLEGDSDINNVANEQSEKAEAQESEKVSPEHQETTQISEHAMKAEHGHLEAVPLAGEEDLTHTNNPKESLNKEMPSDETKTDVVISESLGEGRDAFAEDAEIVMDLGNNSDEGDAESDDLNLPTLKDEPGLYPIPE